MNDDLVHAIGGKHLVEFVYKAGRTRIVEPHDYGIRRGVGLSVFRLAVRVKAARRMDESSTSIRSATYVSWTVGSLGHVGGR